MDLISFFIEQMLLEILVKHSILVLSSIFLNNIILGVY
jgi:hypothetical protein